MEIRYNLHLGEIIHKHQSNSNMTQEELAAKMHMSKAGLNNKFRRPAFGNIYDLIAISIAMNIDFISYAYAALRSNGVAIKKIYTDVDVSHMTTEIKQLNEDLVLYKKTIKKLTDD